MKSRSKSTALILVLATTAIPQIAYSSDILSDQDTKILSEACQGLKTSDKRASCAGVITRLGIAKANKLSNNQPEWIEIGIGPEISEIPYRLINVRNNQGETLKKAIAIWRQ